jgi:hypothetical protein
MNVIQLPSDILNIIFNKMNNNISNCSIVCKELHFLLQERLIYEKKKHERKNTFFKRVSRSMFTCVTTLEECNFLYEKYITKFNPDTFISRVKYTIKNSYQIQAETWYRYLQIHHPLALQITLS